MVIASEPGQLPDAARAVAIGNFDGFHRGHQALIDRLRESAPALRLAAVTFWPHPKLVLEREVRLLTTLERRLQLLAKAGVDDAIVLRFSDAVAAVTAEDWLRSVLRPLGAERVVVGEGFRFGAGRKGTVTLMRSLGFNVDQVNLVPGVSSSAVRDLIASGDIRAAEAALGRPPEIELDLVRTSTVENGRLNAEFTPSSDELVLPAEGTYLASLRGSSCVLKVPSRDSAASGQRITAHLGDPHCTLAPFQRVALRTRLDGLDPSLVPRRLR